MSRQLGDLLFMVPGDVSVEALAPGDVSVALLFMRLPLGDMAQKITSPGMQLE